MCLILIYSAGLGECLSDRPSQEEYYEYPEDPAGENVFFFFTRGMIGHEC